MTLRDVLKGAGVDPPEAILDVELAERTTLRDTVVVIGGSFNFGAEGAYTEVTMTLRNRGTA